MHKSYDNKKSAMKLYKHMLLKIKNKIFVFFKILGFILFIPKSFAVNHSITEYGPNFPIKSLGFKKYVDFEYYGVYTWGQLSRFSQEQAIYIRELRENLSHIIKVLKKKGLSLAHYDESMMDNSHILDLPIGAFVTAVPIHLYQDAYKRPSEYDLVFLNHSLGWNYLYNLANKHNLNEDVTLKELLTKMIEMGDFEGPNRYKMLPLESYLFDQFNISIDQMLMEMDPEYSPILILPIEVLKNLSKEEYLFLREDLNIYNIKELVSVYKSLIEKDSDKAIIINRAVNQLKEFVPELFEYLISIQSEGTMKNITEESIEILNLPPRVYNCLRLAGINLIAELCDKTADELSEIKNISEVSIQNIKAALQEKELSLKKQ